MDRCADFSCSGPGPGPVVRGTEGGWVPTCLCADGYTPSPSGGLCQTPASAAPALCDGVTCSGHGSCVSVAGKATCTCDTGYLVGGVVHGWDRTARAGGGRHFVIEGDEYDTAFFDKQPKFVHYRANTAILTSVQFDHAQLYRAREHCPERFRRLVQCLTTAALRIARWDHPPVPLS